MHNSAFVPYELDPYFQFCNPICANCFVIRSIQTISCTQTYVFVALRYYAIIKIRLRLFVEQFEK